MAETLVAPENDYSSLMGLEIPGPTLSTCIIVPVYNRVDLLSRTLAGISAQTYPADLMAVVIADDGSEEDVSAVAEAFQSGLNLSVVTQAHRGYGAGRARNLGASRADADLLVFFDADCIPDPQAVERHATWHHLADNVVVIGSRHHVDTSTLRMDDIKGDPSELRRLSFGTATPSAGDWPSDDFRNVLHRRSSRLRNGDEAFRSLVSSNFSVRRDVFAEVDGFSADFERWGGEDTELGWRLWNSGIFFVDDPTAAIYHQTQVDEGPDNWRTASRAANDGLIQSKIPHRFYRQAITGISEAPKVSVVVPQPVDERLDELSQQVLAQLLDDVEVLFVGSSPELVRFVERRSADPRFRLVGSVDEAVAEARGEFIALVHGWTALDRRLLSRSVAALERGPQKGWVRSAYAVPTATGQDVYRRAEDIDDLDSRWGAGLPVFGLTRRRDLMKLLRSGSSAESAWDWVSTHLGADSHGTPLVSLPAADPAAEKPSTLHPPTSLRSDLLADIRSGGRDSLMAPLRAARSKLTGAPYRRITVQPDRPPKPAPEKPVVRYIGWTGRSNMGDEAMLQATQQLFSWAEIDPAASGGQILMLGGGTLINRGYLKHLRPHDSPRVERLVFGTGVANPEYWGEPREDLNDWVKFLDSCLYVGVRGPRSAELLSRWGFTGELEIVGDPALSLHPAAGIEKTQGRVVVCPAWSRGLLWGESDEAVIQAFSDLIRHLKSQGHEVWALSAFPADDRHIIDMMRNADAPDLPYLAAHDDPRAAMDLLASADLCVAERLHGAVMSAAAGTLPVLVEYRPKLRDFAESIGLEKHVIRTDRLGGGALRSLVDEVLADDGRAVREMRSHVSALRDMQARAAARIEEAIK